jgi:hypothetical protein
VHDDDDDEGMEQAEQRVARTDALLQTPLEPATSSKSGNNRARGKRHVHIYNELNCSKLFFLES